MRKIVWHLWEKFSQCVSLPLLAKSTAALKSQSTKSIDFSEIACTEFGTLPRETIICLGLRHVYTMPVVLEDNSTAQVPIYRAEVLWRKQWRTVYIQESVDGTDEGWRKFGR